MRTVYPVIRYPDPRSAIDWLLRRLRFPGARRARGRRTARSRTPNSSSTPAWSCWAAGPTRNPGRPTTTPPIYVAVSDVDAHCAQARAAGAEIAREPFDTDYGSRDYAARDLAGNVWSFGTYRP